jgi:hypothetical protein
MLVSTHLDPQSVVPPPQLRAHVPCEQTSPASHALPQAPQLLGSMDVLVQAAPHID